MNNILCDHRCPLHESCGRYLEGLVRTDTYHYDPMPFNKEKGKCSKFVPIDEEPLNLDNGTDN
jgi:hypothetical protein